MSFDKSYSLPMFISKRHSTLHLDAILNCGDLWNDKVKSVHTYGDDAEVITFHISVVGLARKLFDGVI